jgi:hypothetical protein
MLNATVFKMTESTITKTIDKLLWLSGPVFKKDPDKQEMLYDEAVLIGRETAKKYPLEIGNIRESIERLNIAEIELFSKPGGERAYYLLEERKICINATFVSEMAEYFRSDSLSSENQTRLSLISNFRSGGHFTYETIMNTLISHEVFHHIEETLSKPTDSLLRRSFKSFASPIYREIAAFAFANAQMFPLACQAIDVYWLKKQHPQKYADIENEYQQIERLTIKSQDPT